MHCCRWPSMDIKYSQKLKLNSRTAIYQKTIKLEKFRNFLTFSNQIFIYAPSSICLKERICGYMHKVDRDGSKEKWKCIWQNSKEGAAKMKSTTAETFSSFSLANLSKTLTLKEMMMAIENNRYLIYRSLGVFMTQKNTFSKNFTCPI